MKPGNFEVSDSAPSTLAKTLTDRREGLESAWKKWLPGMAPPRWQQFLADPDRPLELDWLTYLVETDIEYRIKAGLPALLGEPYFLHPTLQIFDAEGQAKFVRWEYQQRWKNGDRAYRAEYQAAYPHLANQLVDLKPRWNCQKCRRNAIRLESEDAATVMCPGCSESYPITVVFRPRQAPEITAKVTSPADFELGEQLGRGGMGVVYRARDLALQRDVAMKILRENIATDSRTAKRFVEEARITGQLQHPGIPAVYQVGKMPDGRPFLALKLIRGRTLDALLKDGEPINKLSIFEAICQAVGFAHAHQVIHRDLKPANIMVGRFGEVQVMDWGLAKVLSAEPQVEPVRLNKPTTSTEIRTLRDAGAYLTEDGSVQGTLAFMAPEQAAGEQDKIDARADVFGLGAVLCCMLTGQPPLDGPNAEALHLNAMRGATNEAIARLRNSDADPAVVALCIQCLEFERDERPADAGAVATAVAAIRAAADERAKRAELERTRSEVRAAEQRKRRKVQLALFTTVVLLLIGGGIVAWWQARLKGERDAEHRFKVEQARQGVQTNLALADDLRKQYKFKAADAALEQAFALAKNGAPELLAVVQQSRDDLAFVVQLDDIRYRKWVWIADEEGKGNYNPKIAPPEYRQAFADWGLDLEELDPMEAAQRITASGVKDDLVAALDDWALYEPNEAMRDRLLEIARQADPGPWLDRMRDPTVRANRDAIAQLAADAKTGELSPASLFTLASLMKRKSISPVFLITEARALHPTNFELAFVLGQHWLFVDPKGGLAIGPYEVARALRPENVIVWNNLGSALLGTGDKNGAIAAYKEAIKRNPSFADARCNLAWALKQNGDIDGAIAEYREATHRDPTSVRAYTMLGLLLYDKGDWDNAIAAHRQAIKYDQETTQHQYVLIAMASKKKGDLEGAIAAYKAAIWCDPGYQGAINDLGELLYDKEGFDNTVTYFKESISQNPVIAKAFFSLGNKLQTKGNLEGAIAAYKQAITRAPNYPEAHNNLGNALMKNADVVGAIAAYKAAITHDPKDFAAYKNLGVALKKNKDLDGAIAAYREAIQCDPQSATAHDGLAQLLIDKGDVNGAAAAYRRANQLDPIMAKFRHVRIGRGMNTKSRRDEAIAEFKEAIHCDPKYATAHYELGRALKQKNDVNGAITAYREAIAHDPMYADAHNSLGIALKDNGDVDGAIAAYKTAISHSPMYVAAHYNLGLALKQIRDVDGAIAAYKAAIAHGPSHARAHFQLGIALAEKGNVDDAIPAYRAAIANDPKYVAAHYNLGLALKQKHDVDGAIAAYKAAISFDPKYVAAHYDLGIALNEKGDLDGSIAAYKAAIAQDPKYVYAHYALGIALNQKGDSEGAITAYKAAIAHDSKYVYAHYALGGIYTAQKNYTEAIACARAAIQADPKYSDGHFLLGYVLQLTGDISQARVALTEAARLDPKRWGPRLAMLPEFEVLPPPREALKP